MLLALAGRSSHRELLEASLGPEGRGWVNLDAVWAVGRTRDGASRTGRTTVREPAPDKGYDALAAAHSRAVARLSQDIADAVRALEGPGTR